MRSAFTGALMVKSNQIKAGNMREVVSLSRRSVKRYKLRIAGVER